MGIMIQGWDGILTTGRVFRKSPPVKGAPMVGVSTPQCAASYRLCGKLNTNRTLAHWLGNSIHNSSDSATKTVISLDRTALRDCRTRNLNYSIGRWLGHQPQAMAYGAVEAVGPTVVQGSILQRTRCCRPRFVGIADARSVF